MRLEIKMRSLFIIEVVSASLLILLLTGSGYANKTTCPPCKPQLDCNYPKTKLVYKDTCGCNITVCTCRGTNNRNSENTDYVHALERAKTRYTNCTVVKGNLEIVAHKATGTLDFAKDVVEVQGYVLIMKNEAEYINLSSLRLIRGSELYGANQTLAPCGRSQPQGVENQQALYVAWNLNLKELWMPNLIEITTGNATIQKNYKLCHMDTIEWKNDIFNDGDTQHITIQENQQNSSECNPCPDECTVEDKRDGGLKKTKLCWSSRQNPLMCQQASKIVCGPACSGTRCNPKTKLCCKDSCAAACNAEGEVESKRTCYACKDLNKDGECVSNCPGKNQDPLTGKITGSNGPTFQYAQFCVTSCPANTVSHGTDSCTDFCPDDYYPFDGKKCEKIEEHKCANESLGCDKVCPGLFTPYGNLSTATNINSDNIHNFDKSCTIIDGSLMFNTFSFDKDSHCKTKGLKAEDLAVFENVREITGSISFEAWLPDGENLCVFRKLQKIGGKQLKDDAYALTVFVGNSNLRYLCLDSLQTITTGGFAIVDNPFLCLTDQVNWNLLSKDGGFSDNRFALRPNTDLICRNAYINCHPYLDYVRSVKWKKIFASSSNQNLVFQKPACTKKDSGNCIKEEEQECGSKAGCPRECVSGCWGGKPWQCVKCKNFEDRTDAEGRLTSEPITVNGRTIPGVLNTTCVEQCDFSKGVYAANLNNNTLQVCLPCHPTCYKTCDGGTPFNCTGERRCKDYLRDQEECVSTCPADHYANPSTGQKDKECLPCAKGCMSETKISTEPKCSGPADKWSREDGCSFCHKSEDKNTGEFKYEGHRCYKCQKTEGDYCRYGCTIQAANSTEYQCYNPNAGMIAGIVVTVVLVLVFLIAAGCYYNTRQKRKTLAKIQSVMNYRDTDNEPDDEDIEMPILAPAHKANLAQLRIVTESELQFGKLLGSGAFGEVCKAIWTPFSIQGEKIQIAVAVKTLKTSEDMIHDANNQVMEEAYIMASVDCTYLTRLLGICMRDQVSLITQLMPLGSLLEYIRDPHYKSQIRSRQMLTWCLQIAKGMKYLEEEKHLVHRDLAARNVLVKTPNHVKITDFGLAKMLDVKEDIYYAEGGKLPIKWLALECITERTFSHLSDVWAYGVTCWEIFMFGSRPYEGVKAIDMLSLLERGDRLPQPTCATIDIYMLLIKCWMVERLCRPTFAELVAEFTKMVMNPARYLVLKTDDLTSPAVPISPTMDETEFFRELLQEERMVDGVVMADEPDQYLLCSNVRSESQSTYTDMSRRTSLSTQPQYTNQDSILRVRYENGTDQTSIIEPNAQQDGSAGGLLHPTTANNNFAPRRTDRLFSRNTPSAHPASSSSSANTRIASESASTAAGEGAPPSGSTAAIDDVFAEHSLPRKGLPNASADSCRKDSDESQRYTEDPTTCQRLLDDPYHADGSKGSYMRHMSMKESIAEEDEGDYIEGESFRYDNEDYLMPEDVANSSSTAGPSRTSSKQRSKAIVLENLPEDDYATTFSDPKAEERVPMASRTCFNNEEYMTTDSGIGDDTQSLLSRNGRSHNERNHSNRSSNESEDGRTAGDDSNTTPVHFKPSTPLLDDTSDSTATVVTPNTQMWLENPEYMLLNNGDGLDVTTLNSA